MLKILIKVKQKISYQYIANDIKPLQLHAGKIYLK